VASGKKNEGDAPAVDSRRFHTLNRRFPLRPIRSDGDLAKASAIMEELLRLDALDPAEDDYLDVLGDLVWKYEEEHDPMPEVSGEDMLRHIIESRDLTQAEVARGTGIAEPTISAILAGRRTLNRDHIAALCGYFDVSPALFIVPTPAKG
jgi:HTH-type transcriptional regulator/antitoxin HigA